MGAATGLPFVRYVDLTRADAHTVVAELADHLHHFRVRVAHADGRVTAVTGAAIRAPWSVCPAAAAHLAELVGAGTGELPRVADAGAHCTHQLDLAGHAIRFAGGPAAVRRFEVVVRDWDTPTRTATATRDDGPELAWTVQAGRIVAPPPYAGQALGGGFSAWAARALDPDHAELALLLRRATVMSPARGMDLDRFDRLEQTGLPVGTCFASQPERIATVTRNRGSSLAGVPERP